jgi:hypothetical protein
MGRLALVPSRLTRRIDMVGLQHCTEMPDSLHVRGVGLEADPQLADSRDPLLPFAVALRVPLARARVDM